MKKSWSLVVISFAVILLISLITYTFKTKKELEESKNYKKIANNTVINISKTETGDEVIYDVIDNSKKLSYSWTFNKDEGYEKALKSNMELDLNLKLDVLTSLEDKNLDSLVTNEDKLIVSFEHHGKLPTKAKVKIDVSDKYTNGSMLYLYYLNEEERQVEYIDKGLSVINGKVEFEIEHCSNYFLTASIVQDAVNNPKNVNLIIIVMVVVIIVLIGATLFQNKK